MTDIPTLAEIRWRTEVVVRLGNISLHPEIILLVARLRLIPADAELFDEERLARALRTIHPGPAPWPGPMTSDEMAAAILRAAKEAP